MTVGEEVGRGGVHRHSFLCSTPTGPSLSGIGAESRESEKIQDPSGRTTNILGQSWSEQEPKNM